MFYTIILEFFTFSFKNFYSHCQYHNIISMFRFIFNFHVNNTVLIPNSFDTDYFRTIQRQGKRLRGNLTSSFIGSGSFRARYNVNRSGICRTAVPFPLKVVDVAPPPSSSSSPVVSKLPLFRPRDSQFNPTVSSHRRRKVSSSNRDE